MDSNNYEAEQSVLGSMLIDETCIPDVVAELSPADFSSGANRDIYEAIDSMFSLARRVDPITVLEQMRAGGTFSDSTRAYLLEIASITPTSANVLDYVKIVKDSSAKRQVREVLTTVLNDTTSTGEQLLANAQDALLRISQGKNAGVVSMPSITCNFLQALEERKMGIQKNSVPTNFRKLDAKLSGGLLKKGLYILAGRPGMGKTSLALNIAAQVHGSVLYISLEMDVEQIAPRMFARLTGIASNRLLTATDLTREEFCKVAEATPKMKQDFYINSLPQMDVGQIGRLARSVPNLSLIVIDYLGLIESQNPNRYSRISDISAALKMLARRLDVPILALAQLSRAVESRDDKRPTLADLRDSGAIEQDADGVLFVYRPEYYQKDLKPKQAWEPSFVDVIIAKNRHGITGSVGFNAFLANNIFSEI